MTSIASAEGLHRFFPQGDGRLAVLQGLSLDVGEGEFVCVMGPSGSGKTTLLHVLSGLDVPDEGRITLGGRELSKLSEHERVLARRRTVGYVFQFFNLLPNLRVWENAALPLAIQGRTTERGDVEEVLAAVGLEGRMEAYPHQLSGGEMQRASIARALAGGQPLLLCDEPTGNLSQNAGLGVMKLLRRLRDEDGRSLLLVTHNPRDATFADRVLFLVDGKISPEVALEGDISMDRVHDSLAALSI